MPHQLRPACHRSRRPLTIEYPADATPSSARNQSCFFGLFG